MNQTMTTFPDNHREPRTVVHAGPLVLSEDDARSSLGHYLGQDETRHLVLVHHGQPALRAAARAAGIEDIKVDQIEDRPEDEFAADMAVAISARELEFTIDRPALKNSYGHLIGELTLHEAEVLAADRTLRHAIREKLVAGCDALRRGVGRIRIGSPNSLRRNRATVITPDPPIAVGAMLRSGDDPDSNSSSPDRDPEQQPLHFPSPSDLDEIHDLPKLARNPRPIAKSRYSSRRRSCNIGKRRLTPFPDMPAGYTRFDPPERRHRRALARLA